MLKMIMIMGTMMLLMLLMMMIMMMIMVEMKRVLLKNFGDNDED